MSAVLVEVQVDVREREPGAVGLPDIRHVLRRTAHRGRGPLDRRGHVLAGRQRLERALRGRVACARGCSTPFGPGEPFGVRPILGGRAGLGFGVWARLPRLVDHLPRRLGGSGLRGLGRLGRLSRRGRDLRDGQLAPGYRRSRSRSRGELRRRRWLSGGLRGGMRDLLLGREPGRRSGFRG